MNPTTTEITIRPNGQQLVTREEFGTANLQTHVETAASAVAEREKAAVQARYIVAERRPRNLEQFRVRLEESCRRPSFAAKVEYAKPLGQKWNPTKGAMEDQFAFGPTIRFIEVALQAYGNVFPEVSTVFDSQMLRICRVAVTDLESNICYATEVSITKQVERKGKKNAKGGKNITWEPPAGRLVLSERLNSYNEPTYTVVATDDEVLVKQNALLSKALRTNAQRLLPWDIVERCMQIAKETLDNEHAEDPDAAKRRMVDAFTSIGVEPVDLESWLGHSLNKPLVPAERQKLLAIHAAIKDGETSWKEVMEEKTETGSAELQDEIRNRKVAEAEKFKAAQQQQKKDNPNQQSQGSGSNSATAETGETEGVHPSGTSDEIPAASTPGLIDEQQGMDLMALAGEKGIPQAFLKSILERYGFKTPGAITTSKFSAVIKDIQSWDPEETTAAPTTAKKSSLFGGKK
jgi:hypothetical protein